MKKLAVFFLSFLLRVALRLGYWTETKLNQLSPAATYAAFGDEQRRLALAAIIALYDDLTAYPGLGNGVPRRSVSHEQAREAFEKRFHATPSYVDPSAPLFSEIPSLPKINGEEPLP